MGYTSEKEDIVSEILISNIFLYLFAFRTISDDDKTYIWKDFFHECERIDRDSEALFPRDTSDVEKSVVCLQFIKKYIFWYNIEILKVVEFDRIGKDRDLISIDAMSDQLVSCIVTRCDHVLDIFVERIIVFPTNLSEDLIIRESENFEISFISNIGVEGADTGNLEKLAEEDCLPSKHELCMEVNNIWLECEHFSQYSWCEGEGESELRIEKRWKSTDCEDFDSETGELLHSSILRNNDTNLMPTLDKLA